MITLYGTRIFIHIIIHMNVKKAQYCKIQFFQIIWMKLHFTNYKIIKLVWKVEVNQSHKVWIWACIL